MLNSIELLDRFEILEPENLALKDLRRCIVDKDIRSVFKIFQSFHKNENIKLVETACLDLNAYAFFKLEENMFGHEDMPLLKKIIWQQNPWAVFSYLANQNVDPIVVKNIKDTQCGFKLFKSDVAKKLFSKQKINGFGFDFFE